MKPVFRKGVLTMHIICSVGWLGAVAGFLALAMTGLNSKDAELVHAAYVAMGLTARFVIVPLALASLLTGVVQAVGTPWGLFRYYWIIAKLLLTVFATTILLLKMPLIEEAARQAMMPAALPSLSGTGRALAMHSAGGLLVLLVITTLSVYKPWGLTVYGRRKVRERGVELVEESPVVTSRWIYVFGTLFLLLIVLRHLLGGHFEHHMH